MFILKGFITEVASVLNSKFGGSPSNIFKSANGSAQSLLKIITENFECYQDCATLDWLTDDNKDKVVTLYKRAQILIGDLWSMFKGTGVGKFDDIDTITMLPDYRVPQSLQYFGALKYSPVFD